MDKTDKNSVANIKIDIKSFVFLMSIISLCVEITGVANAQQTVRTLNPPVQGFFAKYLDCGGIPVRSSAAVEDQALQVSCDKIARMLKNIPSAKNELIHRGAEFHIIGRNEQTSDLPEFRDRRGKVYTDNKGHLTTIDQRTRGMGGLLASCGEENLLHLPHDRYGDGSDICVHEFAHTIMDYGFSYQERTLIKEQFLNSLGKGLWKNAYAATNEKEYWAELSMWYFGAHGDRRMDGTPPDNGPEGLQAYDPQAFLLFQKLYHGYE